MKTLVASLFALSLLGGTSLLTATAANAAGVGVHVGGAGVHIHLGDRHRGYHHRRHCVRWGYRHHQRYCRRWSW